MKGADFKRIALTAATQAGKVFLSYYGKKGAIKIKPNKTLVTVADLKPNHNILSEETGFEDNKSDYKWVIDPIDGTHNFLHEISIFGTSIALEYKNEVILGVLYFPTLNLTAVAEKNKGAFLNGKGIKVSTKNSLEHSFILSEFSYANRKGKIDFLEKLIRKTIDVRNFGCAIYNLLLIASGKCDGYVILSTNEWDVAAGFLLVEEAGGKITDLQGKKWGFHQNKYVVSNGKVHNEILKLVSSEE